LIAAANANDLDFVLMTEHYSDTFDTAAQTLNGVYGKTLFVGGNEIDTSDGDRFLLIPGGGEAAKARMSGTPTFLDAAHRENKLVLITYPEKFKSWDSQFDGIEVFSLHTQAKQMSWLGALGDLIWSYPSYPELTLAKNFQRPDANLAKFDEIASRQPISLFAGTDAHSNIGFHIFGDDAGNKLLGIKLDPYETIFRIARIHVQIEKDKEFNREALLDAIRAGRYFVGFDAIGDTTGFSLSGSSCEDKNRAEGSHLELCNDLGIRVGAHILGQSPLLSRFVVYRNGEVFSEIPASGTFEFSTTQSGAYRVEVYRDELGPPFDKIPWIISNPIYVQ
jgi:hypothetical protein